MSKIELTEYQSQELHSAWCANDGVGVECYGATLNKAIELGLVRPAIDDLAARVAALEAKYETLETATLDPSDVDETPDPHAAAKERAKLWGARLIRCRDGWFIFVTDRAFTVAGWSERADSLGKSDAVLAEEFTGQWSTEYDAWSNFPTVPPPGWEAPKGEFQKALDLVDARAEKIVAGIPPSQRAIISQAAAKPHTDADRLGALADAAYMAYTHDSWESHKQAAIPNDWRNVAHAVRKVVLAGQLEPTEEEIDKACDAYLLVKGREPGVIINLGRMVDALRAAARVRLEKAEGEQS